MPDAATIPGIIDRAIAAATAFGVEQREVVLVRHGQPLPEPERRESELLDPPLSALGRRQAERAALALDGVTAVFCSDLARAGETAAIVGGRLGVPVRETAGLREITVFRGDLGDAAAWTSAAAAFVSGGRWESFLKPDPASEFRLRVRRAFAEIASDHATGTVAVVCHSGVINAHLADTLSLDRDYFVRPAHASLSRVCLSSGRWVLQSVNETAHLRPDWLTA
ncbi:histidine phosphatase family protein [Actinomadura sp. DC4]|uniref:histidine phosphatase family protein n=1 Tax=Actinomadura sp. DC4 TaxID=3055069 RepID=UPI0025AF5859|nr:histidine phosphatase family protein [Actinomadura sp. DC4]MDN3354207.1 histidine phosphatase family protein [Actinomadura sp. DC4]